MTGAELGIGWRAGLSVAAMAVTVAVLLLSALLHRSGPIRLRHWSEQVGGSLRALYENRQRFEVFRYLVYLLSVLCPLVLLRSLVWLDPHHRWGLSLLTVALVVAVTDIWNRRIGGRAEGALLRLTPLYRLVHLLLRPLLPVVGLLARSPGETIDGPLEPDDEVSDEEIDAFIDVGREEGILEPGEEELVRGLVDFGDTQVRSVMTPRVDVVCAPVETAPEELVRVFVESGHSRIPLYQGSIDRIVGILHIRDLMRVLHGGGGDLREALMPPHFVPETKNLAQLLEELQARHQELAIVVDEYGGTGGIVSIEDLLEEIFGEIIDEHDRSEPELVELPDGSWRVRGRAHLEEVEELFDVRIDKAPYESVGGLIFGELGHVPRVGEKVVRDGLEFLVERVGSRRVQTVRISRRQGEEQGDG